MKIIVFWIVKVRRLVEFFRRFGGTCFHTLSRSLLLHFEDIGQRVTLKRRRRRIPFTINAMRIAVLLYVHFVAYDLQVSNRRHFYNRCHKAVFHVI
jgi:hypothetical protein